MQDGDQESEQRPHGRIFNIASKIGRKFEIAPPAGRKFEISGQPTREKPTATRLFRTDGDQVLTRLPRTDREIMFARQRNASDCGPCLVLNTLRALGAQSGLSAVTDVRNYANQLRIARNETARSRGVALEDPTLPAEGWFTNGDVDEVLLNQGLQVRSWVVDSAEARARVQQYVDKLARNSQDSVVYSGTGRHYRGIYRTGNQSFLLDSLQPTISEATDTSVQTILSNAESSDRREFVSVATRPITQTAPTTSS